MNTSNILKITRPAYKECTMNEKLVDATSIITNKCFHTDILNEDFTVRETKRDSFLIGGVLKLKNTYTFGFNEKGTELFEFQPINWRYPKFLVASNIKKDLLKNKEKVTDYFVIIKFKEWKYKLPTGTIEIKLGPIENDINKYDILFYYYPTMPILKPKMIELDYKEPTKISVEGDVYSIDPDGCIDIDDAISYDFEKKRIGIHIADVAEIVKDYKFNRFSTVYAPHKNVPMFPEDISTNLASLREGKIRNVITCWIYEPETLTSESKGSIEVDSSEGDSTDGDSTDANSIGGNSTDDESPCKLKVEFELNQIKVSKNLTYDEADALKISNPSLKILYEKSIKLGKDLNIDVIDTHKMVEVYMILYNMFITKKLEKEEGMIFRNQKGISKAVYNFKRESHSSLGLSFYSHASSPIRRYVDYIIQGIFKGKPKEIVDLDKVNEYEKDIKRLSRMWDYLKASKEMKSGDEYELEFREIQDNRLVFFCEKLNITISNKIGFNILNGGMEINGCEYKLGEKYTRKLYLVDDKKNILFYKILIQF